MANKIKDAFDSVKADEMLKASTAALIRAERRKQARHAHITRIGGSIAAACAVLMLTVGLIGFSAWRTPVAYISIDVNPSIELSLNRFDRVVTASAYNVDGSAVLDGLALSGNVYTDAITTILDSDAMEPYLTDDSALTFTVAAGDDTYTRTIMDGIEAVEASTGHHGTCASASVSSLETAHGCGLSLGKYAAYLELAQYDSSITAEDCHNMTMREIKGLISEHESGHGTGQADGESCDGEHSGNGGTCDESDAGTAAPAPSAQTTAAVTQQPTDCATAAVTQCPTPAITQSPTVAATQLPTAKATTEASGSGEDCGEKESSGSHGGHGSGHGNGHD